jgi:DtxR family transcriptional regulator, Mn-dependent transcriptional regulator
VERIDEMLGRPAHDPHGDPIPDASGVLRSETLQVLGACGPGSYRLVRVARDDPGFLTWLQTRGLVPGARVSVGGRDELAGVITLQVEENGQTVQIGEAVAAALWVA